MVSYCYKRTTTGYRLKNGRDFDEDEGEELRNMRQWRPASECDVLRRSIFTWWDAYGIGVYV